MASNLSNAVRSAMVDAACGLLDAGAGTYPTLVITTSGDSALLTIELDSTRAVAAAVNGVGTFNAPHTGGGAWATFSQNPSASGTAAKAYLKNRGGTTLFQLSVGTSGAEINFDTLTFDTGVAVTTTTAPTITQPAS